LFGVGPILAAKLLGEVGDIGRFAAHTGTAPIEASSGEVVRHRLSRTGNRKLNHALHLIAIVQIRHPTAGRAYYRRNWPRASPARKPYAASSAGCLTLSTASRGPTSTDPLSSSLDYRGAFFGISGMRRRRGRSPHLDRLPLPH
jgi:transposase